MTHNKSMTDAEYIRELEANLVRFRYALKQIASCEKRAENDIVDVARNALGHNWHEEIKDMEAEG